MTQARLSPSQSIDPAARIILATLAVVWLFVVFGGGSSRADVLYLVAVRFVAVAGLAVVLIGGRPDRISARDKPLLFAAAITLAVVIQLIPLPHRLWTALPGRSAYDALASVPELGQVWRPASLSPDLTWNALLSILPPLFFLIAVPMLGTRFRRWLLVGLLWTILASALLGLLQLAGGPQSDLRWYQFSNIDAGTGFFANRNHEAVFLAMGIPLAVWWAVSKTRVQPMWPRLAIGASIVVFLLVAVVTTQSRMGLVTVALALILSGVYFLRQVKVSRRRLLWLGAAVLVGGALAALALTAWLPARLSGAFVENDLRIRILPESLEAARTFFPAGAGFGAFPNVFPRFESIGDLTPEYVNHTHSELTQIVIEGGVLALLLLLLFLGWCLVAFVRVWRRQEGSADQMAEARLCTILIILPLVGSVTDYPIRAPLMACSLAMACALLNRAMLGSAPLSRRRPATIKALD